MSIWTKIIKVIELLSKGETLSSIFKKLKTPPEKTIGFTIAVIALSAKMAKADGLVKPEEVRAFKQIFHIPESEEKNASRVFNLARQDVHGFKTYAKQIAKMLSSNKKMLEYLTEGLLHIATSDGEYNSAEDLFVEEVAKIFAIEPSVLGTLKSRYIQSDESNPYTVLGASPSWTVEKIKSHWKTLVLESHPDRLTARGLPKEAINLANCRLVAINKAWSKIKLTRYS